MGNAFRFLVLLMVVILLGFFSLGNSTNPAASLVSSEITVNNQLKNKNRQAFILKSHAAIDILPNLESSDSISCRESWSELVKMDANLWGEAAGHGVQSNFDLGESSVLNKFIETFNYSSRCHLAKQHPLKAVSDEVRATCYRADVRDSDFSLLSCMNAIVKLRFEAIDYLTSEQSLERIEDVSILGAKILAQVIGDNSKRDFDKLIATSRRILDLEPDNVTAAEYWVQGAYLKLISTSDTEAINQFEVASREISERFPNSPLAFESLMAVARERKDFGMIRKLVDEKKEVGLDSNVLSYHLAWVSFLEGRDEESKSHLNEILQQNPEDVRAKMSMESLIRDEAVSKETREQEVPFSDNLGSFKYSIALGPAKN